MSVASSTLVNLEQGLDNIHWSPDQKLSPAQQHMLQTLQIQPQQFVDNYCVSHAVSCLEYYRILISTIYNWDGLERNDSAVGYVLTNMPLEGKTPLVGLALYVRPNGSGHAVNFCYRPNPDTNDDYGPQGSIGFKDYQQDPIGQNTYSVDVFGAKRIMLIYERTRCATDSPNSPEIFTAFKNHLQLRAYRKAYCQQHSLPVLPDAANWPAREMTESGIPRAEATRRPDGMYADNMEMGGVLTKTGL